MGSTYEITTKTVDGTALNVPADENFQAGENLQFLTAPRA
jgi:hypothetical protein